MRTMTSRLIACALALSMVVIPGTASAADDGSASEIIEMTAEDTIVGDISYNVYLPEAYDDSGKTRYPVIYLLHGRGDTKQAWTQVKTTLDGLIAANKVQPLIAVMPDAPWNDAGHWYTDSEYSGSAASGPGLPIETAFTNDLVAHVDQAFPTFTNRESRAIGGYSMGGAGALRMAVAHPDMFSAALVLSPAVYTPLPPADSSTRDYGAYGVGDSLFDSDRYTELSYTTEFASFDSTLPLHMFIAVGDDEWPNPDPAEAENDIDFESAKLYNKARRVPGITAELRVMGGGHDWGVWERGFAEGIEDISSRLVGSQTEQWNAELFGSAGDDRAGGVLETADGGTILALNLVDTWDEYQVAGGMDIVLVKRDSDGIEQWRHALATPANERAYGLAASDNGSVLVAGYTRGDLETGEVKDKDRSFVAKVDAQGNRLWTLHLGDPATANRFYALSSDGQGGAYVAGYTSGSFTGAANAGDKDAVVARVSADGTVLWAQQIGGPGEDKAYAVAVTPSGDVVVGGAHGSGLPGLPSQGSYDGWVAQYSSDGTQEWIQSIASPENEQVNGIAVNNDGIIAAIGNTRGTIGTNSYGDHDIFVRAFNADGDELWTQQLGTDTDDRGVAIASGANKDFRAIATTYGALGMAHGNVDLVEFAITPDGTVGDFNQFGSASRDGADEWDEANIFLSAGVSRFVLSGLTYGSTSTHTNQGYGDIFVMDSEYDASTLLPPTKENQQDDHGAAVTPSMNSPLTSTGAQISMVLVSAVILALLGVVIIRHRSASSRFTQPLSSLSSTFTSR